MGYYMFQKQFIVIVTAAAAGRRGAQFRSTLGLAALSWKERKPVAVGAEVK